MGCIISIIHTKLGQTSLNFSVSCIMRTFGAMEPWSIKAVNYCAIIMFKKYKFDRCFIMSPFYIDKIHFGKNYVCKHSSAGGALLGLICLKRMINDQLIKYIHFVIGVRTNSF